MSKLIRTDHTTTTINGIEIPATIVSGPDYLLHLYGTIKPAMPYIKWAKTMHDAGIAQFVTTDGGHDFQIIDLLLPAEEADAE